MGRSQVTRCQKNDIDAACALWDKLHPRDSVNVSDKFPRALERLGWKEQEPGSYKVAFAKNGIILKFLMEQSEAYIAKSGIDLEWNLWCKTRSYKRKHFAKCFRYHRHRLLFQEQVAMCKCKGQGLCSAWQLASKLNIFDWEVNHGHVGKRVVFFDYDNEKGKNEGQGIFYLTMESLS